MMPRTQSLYARWLVAASFRGGLLACLWAGGCAQSSLRTESLPETSPVEVRCNALTRTQKESLLCQNRHMAVHVQELRRRMDAMQTQIDWLTCPDASVRDFLSKCALRSSDANKCGDEAEADAEIVQDLQRYSHRMVYYPFSPTQRPGSRQREDALARDIDPARLRQLKSWAKAEQLTARSSILVLYMPHSAQDEGPSVESDAHAWRLAREFLRYFMNEILRPTHDDMSETMKVHVLQPRALGCQHRSATMRAYLSRPENRPLGNEPKLGQPRTTIWLFHLNCPLPEPPLQPERP